MRPLFNFLNLLEQKELVKEWCSAKKGGEEKPDQKEIQAKEVSQIGKKKYIFLKIVEDPME